MNTVNQQTAKNQFWTDESGMQIPYNRTTATERKKEKTAFSVAKKAQNAHKILKEVKDAVSTATDEILNDEREANNVKLDGKGNYTWYNFDRSIKIQVDINEAIKFDEIKIASAKEKLMNLIRTNISGDDFIISLVEDAFQTSKGKLDAKRILSLRKHSSRIKNGAIKQGWEEAMTLIDESISRPKSKSYHKIWLKNEEGKYEAIELNFSSL
ncbi:DUF3164 family protein [Chryseobacterium sp. PBS4-4]|uniref:DUF3164 family protein n=1 Tax=Chryseobacterium edaphi TaxID=2976532 RepID=A0ABT2W150_9FLAO|nr:DUF3164 family protein [Chryseobacterium edaphi]MCU7615638.1 DUF3164 family protein [Chryseobacterium edaphi]